MIRLFATILFFLLSISFVAEHHLSYQNDVSQELLQDDESGKGAEEERENKTAKDSKDTFHSLFVDHSLIALNKSMLPLCGSHALLSSGYINRPFTPPDFS